MIFRFHNLAVFISIRAPHAGCDSPASPLPAGSLYFNPCTPCGVRRRHDRGNALKKDISIRAPHAGCDAHIALYAFACSSFQSAHPMRGATPPYFAVVVPQAISIRAPHAGCDYRSSRATPCRALFQSAHPMRGATYSPRLCSPYLPHFNPRTPCGVRQQPVAGVALVMLISIRAPHAGCDVSPITMTAPPMIFQSAHPMRGATIHHGHMAQRRLISIRAPHAGCDESGNVITDNGANFNPRTPCGVRRNSEK